jgi:hypothetical protein
MCLKFPAKIAPRTICTEKRKLRKKIFFVLFSSIKALVLKKYSIYLAYFLYEDQNFYPFLCLKHKTTLYSKEQNLNLKKKLKSFSNSVFVSRNFSDVLAHIITDLSYNDIF